MKQYLSMNTGRNALSLLACLTLILAATGCNTVAGVGQDLEAAGGKIEETAESQSAD